MGRQNAGQALSYGFSLILTGSSRLIVQETIEGGPVHQAGVRRGWELVAIDGAEVSTFGDPASISTALGYPNIREGTTRNLSFKDLNGNDRGPFSVAVADFLVNPVPEVEILSVDSEAIGYVRLRSFVPPAVPAFADAVENFNAAGIGKIVIDLRYNGGGSLAVAEAIAGMVAGSRLRGETIDYLPAGLRDQAAIEPIYEEMEGWSESTRGARSWKDLPANAIKYVRRIEELIGAPAVLLSTSPDRDDIIMMLDPFQG